MFFDGVCNLCNGAIQFVIRHDAKKRFLFAPLQSPAGREALTVLSKGSKPPDSVVLYYKGKYYTESDAALRTAVLLGGGWRLLALGLIVPRFMRTIVYRWIARNRYKWFGRSEACMIPTPELQARFLS